MIIVLYLHCSGDKLTEALKGQNEPKKYKSKTKSNQIKSPYFLFIPSLFDLLPHTDKKFKKRLLNWGAGGGWSLQRQREGLMTVMAGRLFSVSATRKRALQ